MVWCYKPNSLRSFASFSTPSAMRYKIPSPKRRSARKKVTNSSQSYGQTHTLSCMRRKPAFSNVRRNLSRTPRRLSQISKMTILHFWSQTRGARIFMCSAACNFSENFFPSSVKTTVHPRGVARLFIIPCASRRCNACRVRRTREFFTSSGKSRLRKTASGANAAEAEPVVIRKRANITFWRI